MLSMNERTLRPVARGRSALLLLVGAVALAGGTVVAGAPAASAASCSSPVKYAQSSNTIYLLTAQTWSLSDIVAACPLAPLAEVDPAHHVWELSADLVVNNGATLFLHGSGAASPGDVDTLRLRSLDSVVGTDVSAITAHWGHIDADSVTLTSWDDVANGPDKNYLLPSGASSSTRGRAFIRAQSYLDGSTGRVSAMTFVNSRLQYLGYYAAESYGVSWKSEGCSHASANIGICAQAPVTGGATNTVFTNDYMGSYVWGGHQMSFLDSSFDHNTMYGLDTHDVTTYLDVERNHFSYNGDHGFICSQRCDHLTVDSNESDHNGMVKWAGSSPTGESQGGQVHGIMLHRGITNTVVSNNYVHDQPNGGGVAVFDTSNDRITGNRITSSLYGIRISVGSASNLFDRNTITSSTKYGVYTYKGSDTPTYSTSSGHPTGNVFRDNSITGSASAAVQLTETDGTLFSGNDFGTGRLHFISSARSSVTGGLADGDRVDASAVQAEPTDVTLTDPVGGLVVSLADAYSVTDVASTAGGLFLVAKKAFTATVRTGGSSSHFTVANLGTTAGATVTPAGVQILPNTGSLTASAQRVSGTVRVAVTPAVAGQVESVVVSGLVAGGTYTVDGTVTGRRTLAADASGALRFQDTPVGPTTYTIAAA